MKNVVLHTTTLLHWKARQVLRDIFSTEWQNEPRKWQDICGKNF